MHRRLALAPAWHRHLRGDGGAGCNLQGADRRRPEYELRHQRVCARCGVRRVVHRRGRRRRNHSQEGRGAGRRRVLAARAPRHAECVRLHMVGSAAQLSKGREEEGKPEPGTGVDEARVQLYDAVAFRQLGRGRASVLPAAGPLWRHGQIQRPAGDGAGSGDRRSDRRGWHAPIVRGWRGVRLTWRGGQRAVSWAQAQCLRHWQQGGRGS